ncbi:hypothetical protein IW261DRAFT_1498084, partial [Armillaria novae-zelandiae]
IIWGVIGPARLFSQGQVYYALVFFFLIGFLVIFSRTGTIPPASAINYVPWTIVMFIFQYVICWCHFS